jgi:C1A family cysteine protease
MVRAQPINEHTIMVFGFLWVSLPYGLTLVIYSISNKDNAFKFDKNSGGICSEEDYPYVAKRNPACFTNCTNVPGTTVQTLVDVPPGNEKALLSAVAMQPVSIAVKAATFSFLFYGHGVLTDETCGRDGSTDHAVLAVGYGTDLETQQPYFLVKNCWGAAWGDKGYVKVGRKSRNEFGICAILSMASFPILL